MRARLAAFSLLLIAILSACDSGSPAAPAGPGAAEATVPAAAPPAMTPQAPATTAPAADTATAPAVTETPAPPEATTPPTEPPAAAPTTPPASPTPQAAAPTDTPAAPASTGDGPLQLQATRLETTDATAKGVFATARQINLPAGFHIRVYATGLAQARWLGLGPDGVVYATLISGSVVRLPDANKDGVADRVQTFAGNLAGVQGIAFRDGAVYVATEREIIRLQDTDGDGVADKRDVLASDLPGGGGHSTRTLAFGPDGKLYVSVGSSCNVCVEDNPKRAAILRYSADGKFEKVYAKGLRNAVGLVFLPATGDLWATNNGRDGLGDNVPPETIYNVKEDANYGWPYCYGARVPDRTQSPPAGFCAGTGVPAVQMQAHSAPLGLAFYSGTQFPANYAGDLFVAFHGSWNRSVPTGYKLVRIRMKDNAPDTAAGDNLVEDFATGWNASGNVWGRPVDPLVGPDGSLLLTDDKAGAVYSIYYKP
jgi:glucose/arabinose dehydrogenase